MNRRKLTGFKNQSGFSLLIALIFVAFFGAVLTTFVYNQSGDSLVDEANVAGWQAAKIAKAARIYVRDQIVVNPNLKFDLDIAAMGPQEVPLNTLAAAALIPDDIARLNGGRAFSALDQEIIVIMANYPVDGNPNDDTTVPTAYVYFKNSDRSDASLVQDIVESARRQDVALSAPIYSGGTNISGTCNGMGDSVAIWDTGCMGEVEFTALTGEAAFEPGSLLVPAWRAVNFDTRVLMRFPQPENVGMNTMLTELEMGDPLTDCDTNSASRIAMPSDDGAVSDLCGAMSDDVTATNNANADRRRDIIGTRNITGGSYVAYRQSGNDVTINNAGLRTNATTDEDYAFDVNQNVTASGDMKSFDGNINISGTTRVDRNAVVSTETAGKIMSANIGNRLNANGLNTRTLEVINTVDTAADVSATEVFATPTANISNNMTTQVLRMNTGDSQINVSNDANMLGNTRSNTTTIQGSAPLGGFSYVAGNFNARNVETAGNATARNTVQVNGPTRVDGVLNITNASGGANCLGDCPEREQFCIDQGALSYDECMMVNGW